MINQAYLRQLSHALMPRQQSWTQQPRQRLGAAIPQPQAQPPVMPAQPVAIAQAPQMAQQTAALPIPTTPMPMQETPPVMQPKQDDMQERLRKFRTEGYGGARR